MYLDFGLAFVMQSNDEWAQEPVYIGQWRKWSRKNGDHKINHAVSCLYGWACFWQWKISWAASSGSMSSISHLFSVMNFHFLGCQISSVLFLFWKDMKALYSPGSDFACLWPSILYREDSGSVQNEIDAAHLWYEFSFLIAGSHAHPAIWSGLHMLYPSWIVVGLYVNVGLGPTWRLELIGGYVISITIVESPKHHLFWR